MTLTLTVNEADCEAKKCDYFKHYLAYGPAELVHEGFHAAMDHCLAAQNRYIEHLDTCKRCNTGAIEDCYREKSLGRMAQEWETRVRA